MPGYGGIATNTSGRWSKYSDVARASGRLTAIETSPAKYHQDHSGFAAQF
jgi:hypothetical protein